MDCLRAQLAPFCSDADELEARCVTAFAVAIGHHLVAAGHGARRRADVLALITRRLFEP